jgi:YVTN family beta-propeller protein
VLVDAKKPQILVVDTKTDVVESTIELAGHEQPAQIARYSPDGRFLVVTSYPAPLATIFDAKLETQKLLQLGAGPMNMAFHPDGRTVVIANQDAGSVSVVDLEQGDVLRTVPAGVGIETLSFF